MGYLDSSGLGYFWGVIKSSFAPKTAVSEALLEKQDQITGTAGQLVGFDWDGNPAAEDVGAHSHPIGTRLQFAENSWESAAVTNHLPDTNTWVMSNGRSPDRTGGYEFEATFTSAWEAFSCFFDASLLEWARGRTIRFGADYLTGASSRLELVVDGQHVGSILARSTPQSVDVTIPSDAAQVALRIIIFSADDMHCAFSGVYLYDRAEANAANPGDETYFTVRQVMQDSLPATGIKGTMYITEQGGLYFTGQSGQLIPLGGPPASYSQNT